MPAASICESTAIIDYLEATFPEPSLTPADAIGRERMRVWERWSDGVGHAAVYVPTWDKPDR